MRKNLLVVLLSLALTISACNAQSPDATVAPTLPGPQVTIVTVTPNPTETLSAQPTATPTLGTPIPTNSPDCTNSAAFVADVAVADNDIIASGQPFIKTWRIRNTGTCIWGPNYTVTHYSEERMLAPDSVPLSVTFPNQTVDISMELIAPTTDGTHRGYFVIKNPAGLIMKIDNDSRLWVVINVSSALAAAPATAQGAGEIPVTGGFANAACAFTVDAAKVTETIKAINTYRTQNGLPLYAVNELLGKAAAAHANDMACNKIFGHTGSNDSTPDSRVAVSGYVASSVAENVYGSNPPLSGQGVLDWWKNDKTDITHNQNLLSTTFTEIGVGYSFFDNFGNYVIVFARPK